VKKETGVLAIKEANSELKETEVIFTLDCFAQTRACKFLCARM